MRTSRRVCEGETESRRHASEPIASPTPAKRDRDGQDLWPEPAWDTIEVSHDLDEQIVGIQLLDRGLQERAGPWQLRRACRELAHGTRTELRPPPLGIKLLLGASGVFEVFVDVDRQRADRMHGYTSTERSQALRAWRLVGGA